MEKKNLKSLKSHGTCCCCLVNVALSICETLDYSLPFAYLGLLASYASSQWTVSNGKKKKLPLRLVIMEIKSIKLQILQNHYDL